MKTNNPISTYQARLDLDDATSEAFDEMAKLLSRVERSLFADMMAGKKISELKI